MNSSTFANADVKSVVGADEEAFADVDVESVVGADEEAFDDVDVEDVVVGADAETVDVDVDDADEDVKLSSRFLKAIDCRRMEQLPT